MHASADGPVLTLEPRIRLSRNPVVYSHSAGGSAGEINRADDLGHPVRHLVRFGFSVIALTLDAEDWWGTPEGVARTRDAIADHRARLGGVGPVVFYAISMGTTTTLQTALTMLDDVACIVLALPCLDLEEVRRREPVLRPLINESWDRTPINTNLSPLPAGANPIDRAPELGRIPILVHVASDDPVSINHQRFASDHGNTTIVELGAFGHSAEALSRVDPAGVAAFVQSHT